ncbi:MAG: hypothetical protein HYY49_06585 [Ignavibacteriales bacterium]|nr:hypothetical protein [Ignavibacteriales bacterium]
MYERCLSEAERVLAAHKEVIVPVKTVWHEVVKHSKQQRFEVPSIADFTTMLEADTRFEFVPAHESIVETVTLPHNDRDVEELELESLGFFGEDRVKLRKVKFAGEFDVEEPETEDESDLPVSHGLTKVFSDTLSQRSSQIAEGKTKHASKNHPRNGLPSAHRKRSTRKTLRKSR